MKLRHICRIFLFHLLISLNPFSSWRCVFTCNHGIIRLQLSPLGSSVHLNGLHLEHGISCNRSQALQYQTQECPRQVGCQPSWWWSLVPGAWLWATQPSIQHSVFGLHPQLQPWHSSVPVCIIDVDLRHLTIGTFHLCQEHLHFLITEEVLLV